MLIILFSAPGKIPYLENAKIGVDVRNLPGIIKIFSGTSRPKKLPPQKKNPLHDHDSRDNPTSTNTKTKCNVFRTPAVPGDPFVPLLLLLLPDLLAVDQRGQQRVRDIPKLNGHSSQGA